MGSCSFDQLGNGRYESSRKGKKSSSGKQIRQPQRGLGVAQLEKIRLQNEMIAGYLSSLQPPFHSNFNKMGFGDSSVSEIIYGATARSLYDENNILLPHHLLQSTTLTLPLFEKSMEKNRRDDRCPSIDSISQNSGLSNSSDLDLELGLSL